MSNAKAPAVLFSRNSGKSVTCTTSVPVPACKNFVKSYLPTASVTAPVAGLVATTVTRSNSDADAGTQYSSMA